VDIITDTRGVILRRAVAIGIAIFVTVAARGFSRRGRAAP
jgi:hypothetical protein